MHDIVLDQIDHIAGRRIVHVVVNGDERVVLVPAPVFLPGEAVSEQTAVGRAGEARVQIHEIAVFPIDAANIARRFRL